jgi:hypothetical protein
MQNAAADFARFSISLDGQNEVDGQEGGFDGAEDADADDEDGGVRLAVRAVFEPLRGSGGSGGGGDEVYDADEGSLRDWLAGLARRS